MSAVPIVVLVLAVLLALAVTLYKFGIRGLASILGAFVAGVVCYFVVGLFVPRITGEGHFFSTPFGGLRVGDIELVLSILTWTFIWWVLFRLVAVVRRRG